MGFQLLIIERPGQGRERTDAGGPATPGKAQDWPAASCSITVWAGASTAAWFWVGSSWTVPGRILKPVRHREPLLTPRVQRTRAQ